MESFISKIIFSEVRNGVPVVCAAISNASGKSDAEMIEAAESNLKRWKERGHDISYRVARNYKISV